MTQTKWGELTSCPNPLSPAKVGPLLVVNRVNFTPINGLEKWVSPVFFFTPISGFISPLFFCAHLVGLELSEAFFPAA